ncbi:hypothetical protein A3B55_02560 [Candidatus Daviesbacteria bacterium RIFCSPLOWO2_01_FULL_43_15]|nr:MAG: hypothetical protein A3B55_02560 [Candidatus Daviesbacteria bacterium RIFCSPLOWO2_01_FULL_43_15]
MAKSRTTATHPRKPRRRKNVLFKDVLRVGLNQRGSLGMTPKVARALVLFQTDIKLPKKAARAILEDMVVDGAAAKYRRKYYHPDFLPEND